MFMCLYVSVCVCVCVLLYACMCIYFSVGTGQGGVAFFLALLQNMEQIASALPFYDEAPWSFLPHLLFPYFKSYISLTAKNGKKRN